METHSSCVLFSSFSTFCADFRPNKLLICLLRVQLTGFQNEGGVALQLAYKGPDTGGQVLWIYRQQESNAGLIQETMTTVCLCDAGGLC